MMSIPKALKIAEQNGVKVGPVVRVGTVASRTVGDISVRYDNTTGGAACWWVYGTDGVRVPRLGGYQGEAIQAAVLSIAHRA